MIAINRQYHATEPEHCDYGETQACDCCDFPSPSSWHVEISGGDPDCPICHEAWEIGKQVADALQTIGLKVKSITIRYDGGG